MAHADQKYRAEELWRLSAVEAARAVREGRVSARDLVESSLDRIDRHDDWVRGFITVAAGPARTAADAADRALRAGHASGALHGVPVAIKDTTLTQGIRTTFGSPIYADNVPEVDDLCVARLKAAGAIVIGKTNMPEFAFGPRSVNRLRGPTATPYDAESSAGGSSGGSAAAVAIGMVPLAHGTDFGGSVRTPASFCGIIGLRPTPGRIPNVPKGLAWDAMATHGILARSAGDAGLMLSVMAGRDDRDPVSIAQPGWSDDGQAIGRPRRLAASIDLGVAPIAAEVAEAFRAAVEEVASVSSVEWAAPDCSGGQEAFETLRAASVLHAHRGHLHTHREQLTDQARWNMERGEGISAAQMLAAEQARSRIYARFIEFFERFEFLLLPSASVLPFPNTQEEVLEIDGKPLRNPIDYLSITYLVSLVGMPCLSIPCGWVRGLPFGLQIVGPPLSEARLLGFARLLERKCGFVHQWPAAI